MSQNTAWFVGMLCGDGYISYGRVAFDTTSQQISKNLLKVLKTLTINENIKFEVYGNPEKFKIYKTPLVYGLKSQNSSDTLKIKIDSVKFSKTILQLKEKFLSDIDDMSVKEQISFLKGFFDAEATVSPDCTIQIDLSKKTHI